MRLPRSIFRWWIFELLVWLVGLFWAVLSGAETFSSSRSATTPSNKGVRTSSSSVKLTDQRTHEVEAERQSRLLTSPGIRDVAEAQLREAYGRLPLGFEINRGQAKPNIDFLSVGTGYSFLLSANSLSLQVITDSSTAPDSNILSRRTKAKSPELQTLRIQLLGANPKARAHGSDRQGHVTNYLIGGDSRNWKLNVARYSRVRYNGVYPGIDVVYYGSHQMLEYDFVVTPSGDPSQIRLKYDGLVENEEKPPLSLDTDGSLLIQTRWGELRQAPPTVFQYRDGKHVIPARYSLQDNYSVAFSVSDYDHSLPLTIDPILTYSVAGIGGTAISVDSQGAVYVAGVAQPEFVVTSNAFQKNTGGGSCVSGPNTVPCTDILVAKLNPEGTDLEYSTFLGGNGSDYAYGLTVDLEGNAYLTGATSSTNFPTSIGVVQPSYNRAACGNISPTATCNNAFLAKLNSAGSGLVYSTYLNGAGGGLSGNGLAVDSDGNAYVTGDRSGGSFVTKLNAKGSETIYSMPVGGSAVAVDASGSAFVTGRKGNDSFVTKLDGEGSTAYSFRLGGTFTPFSAPPEEVEALTGIAVDGFGNAYVTGYTAYKDFPTTPGVPFPEPPGLGICGNSLCRDAFVSKLNPSGTSLLFSTFLGGDSIDYGTGIALDSLGSVYVTGVTRSSNFPTSTSATQSRGGIFVAKLNPNGTVLNYSILLGAGDSRESGNAICVSSTGDAYITGTAGPNFPITQGSYRPFRGANEAFVARVSDDLNQFVPIVLSSSGQNNAFFTSELTLTNRAARDVALELTYTAAFGGGSGKVTDSLAAGRQRIIPDAISYLRSQGLPIPDSGNRGGTLQIRFVGLNSTAEGAVTVRTTTPVNQGRVGLAYAGVTRGLAEPCYLFGLRHNSTDRSNLAIQNTGNLLDGTITLRLTVLSGLPSSPLSKTLPDEILAPGEFRQLSSILQSGGLSLSNGFVRVERIEGNAPYYAYAVINDQASSDGSFIEPVPAKRATGLKNWILPVAVETTAFDTELVLANSAAKDKIVTLAFVADNVASSGSTAALSLHIRAREQLILPNIVRWMRQHGAIGLQPDTAYVGSLFISSSDGDVRSIYVGGRTATRGSGSGARYGVFYGAVANGESTDVTAWLYGLQQNSETRTNLGIVNPGEKDGNPDTFRIEIFDGDTGANVSKFENITVAARRLQQIDAVLQQYSPGVKQAYMRVTRVSGSNPFIAFSVINDGGTPGDRTGDGAFLGSR